MAKLGQKRKRTLTSNRRLALIVGGAVVIIYVLDSAKLPFLVILPAGILLGGVWGLVIRLFFGKGDG